MYIEVIIMLEPIVITTKRFSIGMLTLEVLAIINKLNITPDI